MFVIECRLMKSTGRFGPFFAVWQGEDGPDSASYLKKLVGNDPESKYREYRMIFQASTIG